MSIKKWWGFSKRKGFIPSADAVEAFVMAKEKEAKAKGMLRSITKNTMELKVHHKENHFSERLTELFEGKI